LGLCRAAIEGTEAQAGVRLQSSGLNSDDWLAGTASMASLSSYSSFVPSGFDAKNTCFKDTWNDGYTIRPVFGRFQNLHSLNDCATHKD
jgi:hypothetical protein